VPKNLQVLGGILREAGYNISLATSGSKALDMVKSRPPDLILLDVMMPEMDGFQVCKQLKGSPRTKDIPVIFLTANVETESVVRAFETGAVDYVTKPFNRAELLARVNTHLKLKKAQREIIKLEQHNAVLAMNVTANHELNQPLTVLEGNFELFERAFSQAALNQKQQKYLTRMRASIEKVQTLVEKFSHSDSIHLENYIDKQKMVIFDKV
ncbi:MAG: response regulator, partial [bacterium]|nr:response regulator [bacterium]